MPVYSMTGYANVQENLECENAEAINPSLPVLLGLEMRCVNSRFLDLNFRLSDELRQYERLLRDLISSKLRRGKVDVRVALESTNAQQWSQPSIQQLRQLGATQDLVRAWLPHAEPLSVADVIRLSVHNTQTVLPESAQVQALAEKVLGELLHAREREGGRLAQALRQCIQNIRALVVQARPLVPQLVAQQQKRFLDRWQEAMQLTQGSAGTPAQSVEVAQERALAEALAYSIRIDVAEELTRLDSHLDELDHLLDKGGEIGKRLEFLIQELHREANTLGSKSAVLELTRISVDMKVFIEQMREQVQNIE